MAVTPCAAGTSSAAGGATNATTCTPAPPGSYSTAGASTPLVCGAGTFAPSEGSLECTPCAGGSFQPSTGAATCEVCDRGSYCPEGASQPRPCFAGTYGAAAGLVSADECTRVAPGFWSSMGAADPEPCPVDADGDPIDAFYCPGWEADTEFRGSKPLLVPTGKRLVTETAEEVSASASFDAASFNETRARAEFAAAVGAPADSVVAEVVETNRTDVVASLTLEQDAESFNALAFRQKLAELFGVDVSKIVLSASSGSLIVNYKIVDAGPSVVAAASNTNATALISAAIGVNVSHANVTSQVERVAVVKLSAPVTNASAALAGEIELSGSQTAVEATSMTTEVQVEAACELGYRCLGGDVIPCPPGTHGIDGGDCKACAAGKFQGIEGSTKCDVCDAGTYCPPGSASPKSCPLGTIGSRSGLTHVENCTVVLQV